MYQGNTEFRYCCNQTNKVKYNIKHSPKPINLIPELRESIESLLWYVPGIESVQSYDSYLIDEPLYSEVVFEFILEIMQMSRIQDVKVVSGIIEERDKRFYKNEICINCQKMIFNRINNYKQTQKKETITRAMLRHLRNSIAHGSFTVVNGLVFFRDTNKDGNTTAILKIDILSLNKALKQIENNKGITQERIISKVFKKLGFTVILNQRWRYADMILERNGSMYAVGIKSCGLVRSGYQDQILKSVISQFNLYKSSEMIPVLIYDKIRISEKAKQRLKSEGIILLDRKDIGELVRINDII